MENVDRILVHELIDLIHERVETNIERIREIVEYYKKNYTHTPLEHVLCITAEEAYELDKLVTNSEIKRFHFEKSYIYLSNPMNINYDDFKRLKSKLHIYSVVVHGLTPQDYRHVVDSYNPIIDANLWLKYLKEIKELTEGISLNNSETKKFCILCNRIAEKVSYSSDAHEDFIEGEFCKKKYHSSPATSAISTLLTGKGNCAAYADIVKDACQVLGIEAKVIVGLSEKHGAHAWNQVKLDGNWYNLDLTWSRDAIIKKEKLYWMLKNDTDFNSYGRMQDDGVILLHRIDGKNLDVDSFRVLFNYKESEKNEIFCLAPSIPDEEICRYLYSEDKKKYKWLQSLRTMDKNYTDKGGYKR